jgi:hypothetical protein
MSTNYTAILSSNITFLWGLANFPSIYSDTKLFVGLYYRVRARADRFARRSPHLQSHPAKLEAIEPHTKAIIARFSSELIH